MSSKKAVIALTSHSGPFFADGKKTGVFSVETLYPYHIYRDNGFEVDFVSIDGKFGWDDYSLASDFLSGKDLEEFNDKTSDFNVTLRNIKTPDQILKNINDYKIFYASAGHGCLYDYPTATGLHEIASKIYENNGVVAAVCHGPVIFEGIMDLKTGKKLVEGKSVTAFTDIGEKILKVDDIMKDKGFDTPETALWKLGAKYLSPIGPFDDYSITDGRVVTGANPASASSTAIRSVNALKVPGK
ncbi:hypothetical protein TBLA_0H02470 [Henningerozyma blattae CBS 6284]|uniref:D-lactate dehydratase n=1 Tax=Henningerozyma blattae (strain ATCC 34711 / CBS 6284 / DSM 70876 / NBRC 10599 / NRRL Y-10934 / UCD 77-7) TaxID=1071380 RepID=I2H829_HENB6|nr:hypothetical protein TBLA_0H02470 [Tetrapisispora blattae CBS 6284]CCH62531.1 hypothetical protein TBLA_0H02470 [Tetrapisispora blattae CBS 6284]